MSRKPVLYEVLPSPGVRAVKVLAKALGLEFELKKINLFQKEQHSEEFLKLNPTHTVPTLDDNGIILWDSHAILIYLVEKYAQNDAFYPKDLLKRTKVNQLLFFEASMFPKMIAIMRPIILEGVKGITKSQIQGLEDSYQSIERILHGHNYVTGNDITIADISLVTTLTSFGLLAPIDRNIYPNMAAWMKRMEDLPYYEPNTVGLRAHAETVKKYIG